MHLDEPEKRRMRRIAAGLVIAATLLPVALSLLLAWEQARADQARRATFYAEDVLRRSEETARQIQSAFAQLDQLPGDGCDAGRRMAMQRIDATSSYLQMVGTVVDDELVCTSYSLAAPIPLGPPSYLSRTGQQIRLGFELPFAPGQPFTVVSNGRFAAVIHRALPVDATIGEPGVALAVGAASLPRTFVTRGHFDAAWMPSRPLGPGQRRNERIGDHAVALVSSKRFDLVAIAALGQEDLTGRMLRFATLLVPVGLVAGLLLAWYVQRLAKSATSLAAGIRNGLRDDQFFIVLQPIVALPDRRWVGAEVLLRWRLADGKLVRPDLFIPVAEESAIITAITARVLDKAEPVLAQMVRAGSDAFLSINFSPQDLLSDAMLPRLQALIERTGARPEQVHVEITERAFAHTDAAREQVKRLRALGVHLSIDDFGTGYSSLSELVTFELDVLKIDKAFVDTLGGEAVTSHVAFHIVEMARSLKLQTIAEGIEHEAQAATLAQWGVDMGQGWLFAKPLPAEEFLGRLRSTGPAPIIHA